MANKKTVRTKAKGSNARVKGKNPRQSSPRKDKQHWIEGIFTILVGVYCYYAFITAQPSILDQIIGKFILMYLFGNAVPILCLIIIASGILIMLNRFEEYKETIIYVLLLAFNFMVFLSAFIPNLNTNYKVIELFSLAAYGGYGGIIGTLFAYLLNALISRVGTVILLIVMTLIELVMIVKINFPNFYSRVHDNEYGIATIKDKFLDFSDDMRQKRAIKRKSRSNKTQELDIDEDDVTEYLVSDSIMQREGDEVTVDTQYIEIDDELLRQLDETTPERSKKKAPLEETETKDYMYYMDREPEEEPERADSTEDLTEVEIIEDDFQENTFKLPSVELLTMGKAKNPLDTEEIKENARKIKETLNNFKIDASIRSYERGPSITRYEIKPAPGVKVSKIVNLADDLALALATSDIRIEAPIPGKDAIGIEVPNKKSEIVHLREIVDSDEFMSSKYTLPFSVGKTLSGKNIVGDISNMPHLLIAGSTGAGKSVCINSIIVSLLYREAPKDLKMIMIDPKMVELSQYNAIPHLLIPVVTDPEKAAAALGWAINEMEDRYNLFSETGVKDLETYNELIEASGEEKLPRIVIIIDELADLMMTSPKEVEGAICRIAQKARACGIHLIIATQRPSVDVITGLIKSNIPSRIAFAVASNTDSRTIIDTAGAEKLLGKGDMLYKPVTLSKPLRLQCPFVSDAEISRVIESVGASEDVEYDESINEHIDEHVEKKKVEVDEKRDALYEEAIEVAFNNHQVSTSMLQRRLGIGYARAGRIIDTLERDGIISGPNGSKPRKLLVAREEINI